VNDTAAINVLYNVWCEWLTGVNVWWECLDLWCAGWCNMVSHWFSTHLAMWTVWFRKCPI